MPLASETLGPVEWALLGISIVLGVMVARWFPWRGAVEEDEADERKPVTEKETVNSGPSARVGQLEVRLHDFAREVEARLETRAAQLDRLVAAADHEIIRLKELLSDVPRLAERRPPDIVIGSAPKAALQTGVSRESGQSACSALSPAEREMAGHLQGAGFSIPEIAHMVGKPPEVVQSALRAA
jgi:DNA-directed RNA polymerase specialized sigma24 family protein